MPSYSDIIKRIEKAILRFNKGIPAAQRSMFDAVMQEVAKLDTDGTRIKPTVANLSRIARIKAKLSRLILTDDYKAEVKEFAKAFNDVTRLQNEYWRSVEKDFKPRPLLKAVRKQAISDTVQALTEAGLDANVAKPVTDILQRNITTGGSIKDLTKSLRESLLNTETPGTLERYSKTITQTSINTYSRQYTQIVSSDLGYEWYRYANTLIKTSREFCLSMRQENQYFHVSMIPALLRAEGLYYTDPVDDERKKVQINPKTKLPYGFLPETNVTNFLINLGGYNCGHQPQPISEGLVPAAEREKIMQREDYKRWARVNKKEGK